MLFPGKKFNFGRPKWFPVFLRLFLSKQISVVLKSDKQKKKKKKKKKKKERKKEKKRKKNFLSSFCNFSSFYFQFSTFPLSIFLLFCSIFPFFIVSLSPVGQQSFRSLLGAHYPPTPPAPACYVTDGNLYLVCNISTVFPRCYLPLKLSLQFVDSSPFKFDRTPN